MAVRFTVRARMIAIVAIAALALLVVVVVSAFTARQVTDDLLSIRDQYLPKVGLRAVVFASMVLVSVGFVCMSTLTPDSSYLDVLWPLLVISSGFGLCTAPTTSAIMTAAPDAKQGVASAVNDATREVGGALGIAMAGSILAGSYSRVIAPALAPFPEPVRGPASDSLAQALVVAERLGPQGNQLADTSKAAFVDAVNSSYVVMAVIVGVAAVVIPVFAPGRDGKQLRMIRRLNRRGE